LDREVCQNAIHADRPHCGHSRLPGRNLV
jgi:hypothetical protein